MAGRPDPKPVTEGGIGRPKPPRGWRRRGRVMATPEGWAAIRAKKIYPGYCRMCGETREPIEAHHLVPRSLGGDDLEPNIVGICRTCHFSITRNDPIMLGILAALLTDGEYAYIIDKLGEGGMTRLFGVLR